MINRRSHIFLQLTFLSFSVGCSEDQTSLVEPDAGNTQTQVITSSAIGTAPVIPPVPYRLLLNVDGDFRPGHPISITATLIGEMEGEAKVILALPDVEAARRSGYSADFRYPVREELPKLVNAIIPFVKSSNHTIEERIDIPHPGVYRVMFSASVINSDDAVNGLASVEHAWMYITEEGGHVEKHFDPSLIPAHYKPQPGPFRLNTRKRQNVSTTSTISNSVPIARVSYSTPLLSSDLAPAGNWKLRVHVTYIDEAGNPQPLANAHVVGDTYDIYDGSWESNFESYTDSQGWAEFNCPGVNEDYVGEVRTEYGDALVTDRATVNDPVMATFYGNGAACQYYEDIIETISTPSEVSTVYKNAQLTIPASRSLTSRNLGKIVYRVYYRTDCSTYSGSLVISTYGPCGAIYGAFGLFVQAHEYGHAVMDKGLGIYVNNPNCPSPHPQDLATNLRCAYIEGYADYHATALDIGTANQLTYEQGGWVSSGGDGAIIEGGVGSFLLDVTDPQNDDPLSVSGGSLSTLISTCKVYAGGWTKARGIDDIIFCLENEVDPAVTSTYFQNRSTAMATAQSHSAGVLASQSNVRVTWLQNLYP